VVQRSPETLTHKQRRPLKLAAPPAAAAPSVSTSASQGPAAATSSTTAITHSVDAGLIQRTMADGAPAVSSGAAGTVQRELTENDPSDGSTVSSTESQLDLVALARKVYPLIKQLMQVERERFGRPRWS
jgi:hypothetical protein